MDVDLEERVRRQALSVWQHFADERPGAINGIAADHLPEGAAVVKRRRRPLTIKRRESHRQ